VGYEDFSHPGLLGGLTILGWVITFVAGSVAGVQLWRFRESGRRAGIVLFGYNIVYYIAGLFCLRSPEASVWQLLIAAGTSTLPLLVLLAPRTRALFPGAKSKEAA
jgi:hypothetical protein